MRLDKRIILLAAVTTAALVISTGIYFARSANRSGPSAGPGLAAALTRQAEADQAPGRTTGGLPSFGTITLDKAQLKLVRVQPAGEQLFQMKREAVGSIDFNEDKTVQVFSPFQGRIIQTFAKLGDNVVKGGRLFTVDSPDLAQAESALIAAAATRDLTTLVLARARRLYATQGIAQKDLQQAISDQQTAEGAFEAARNALRVFGKTQAEMNRIVARRRIDPAMVVPSPISGKIVARNAQPGLFVQPGATPAPYTVADISTMWMLACVTESDSPLFHVGQEVNVKVMAYPGRVFEGKLSTMGESVDPNSHRLMVRSEVRDPKHEFKPGMLADFVIRTGSPVRAVAVPYDGVVREGDGKMTVWVTTDGHTFARREVKIGLRQKGYDQIVAGLRAGEMVASEGALFLSNALANASP